MGLQRGRMGAQAACPGCPAPAQPSQCCCAGPCCSCRGAGGSTGARWRLPERLGAHAAGWASYPGRSYPARSGGGGPGPKRRGSLRRLRPAAASHSPPHTHCCTHLRRRCLPARCRRSSGRRWRQAAADAKCHCPAAAGRSCVAAGCSTERALSPVVQAGLAAAHTYSMNASHRPLPPAALGPASSASSGTSPHSVSR